jgi:parallel beta-helix repeat protein
MAGTFIYVNPTAHTNGAGTLSNPLNTWAGVSFTAGNTYLQMAGTTASGYVMVTGAGTKAQPISIGSYGSGAAPVIAGSVIFSGASYVSMSGFSITAKQSAAVVLQDGSNNIQLLSNTIGGSAIGVWMGNNVGGSNLISGNTITGNSKFGVAADQVSSTAGQQNVISNNTIEYSGSHGIELTANNIIVDGNDVLFNGQSVPGSSGIHVESDGVGSGFGNNDTISNNLVAGTSFVGGSDGNGIELDQGANNDIVSANTICGNDGAGVALYDSWNNTVSGNMVFCNSANGVRSNSPEGEIVLASSLNMTSNNTISGNVLIGISAHAPVVSVDTWSANAGNVFSSNALEDFGAVAMYDWGGTEGGDGSFFRTVSGGMNLLGGVQQGASVGASGSKYAFDFNAVSPLGAGFEFAWQTPGSYGMA